MDRRHFLLQLAATCTAASLAAAQPPQDAAKIALLISVNSCRHFAFPRLQYAEADAAAVRDLLEANGYEVRMLTGDKATQAAIRRELDQVSRVGEADGMLLIGLFGHGVQYASSAFFCPHDSDVRPVRLADGGVVRDADDQPRLEPDPQTLIALREILDAFVRSPAGRRVLLADCCREDPSVARAFGSRLRSASLPENMAAIFACSEGEQAFESQEWGHGAFTMAFLEQAGELAGRGPVTANALAAAMHFRVRRLVAEKRHRQTVTILNNAIIDLGFIQGLRQPDALPEPTDIPGTFKAGRTATLIRPLGPGVLKKTDGGFQPAEKRMAFNAGETVTILAVTSTGVQIANATRERSGWLTPEKASDYLQP